MRNFRKITNLLLVPWLMLFAGCFGDISSVDEDYHPGVPVLSAAKLTFNLVEANSAIDAGNSYDFGRVRVGNFKETSFSVKNTGESIAKDIKASGLNDSIRFKGGEYPGSGGTCGQNLEGGMSCLLVVEFIPTSIEIFSLTLNLEYGNGKPSNRPASSSKEISGEGYSMSPEIMELSPLYGPAIGGTIITFTGKYFRSGLSATLAGSPCSNLSVSSSTSFSCVTPAHAAGSVDLILTNAFGQRSGYEAAFTYYAAPIVTSVSQNAGAIGGGTNITITGTAFRNGATVSVGDGACTSSFVNSPTSLSCTTPAHVSGVVDVTVTNSDAQFGTGTNLYTYQAAPTVTSVSPSRIYLFGRTITVIGTGFLSSPSLNATLILAFRPIFSARLGLA